MSSDVEQKLARNVVYGDPFKGFSGFIHLMQAIWVGIWNPFGLFSYVEARSIVNRKRGIAVARGKVMYLMPITMMTLYCLVAYFCGVPTEVLGPAWWFWTALSLYTATSDISTKWLALPIGIVIALVGITVGLVSAGVLDLVGALGDIFEWLSLEFPVKGSAFLAVMILIWNFLDFSKSRVTNVLCLLNNTYDRGRLSKDGDYPADNHRTHSHIEDWLEWGMTFSGTLGLTSIFGDKREREDEPLDSAVVVLHNVPLAGLLKRALSFATSVTSTEEQARG